MRIKLEQLPQHLHKQTALLYTLFGDETLLILEASDLILTHVRQQGYTERRLFIIDQHFDWSGLLNIGNNLSLFGDRKIMDIRILSSKLGKEGNKTIEAYCNALPPDTFTLIILPRIDKQGQATKWFQCLERKGTLIPVYNIEHDQLPDWIEQRLIRQNQKADSVTLQFFADQVEGNLIAAHQEIQKLALLYPSGNLTFNQVEDVVLDVARYDLYKLADAMIASNIPRYIRILTGLQGEGAAPLLILSVLAEQIRQLIIIHQGLANNQPPAQILRAARIWVNRQELAISAAKRISLQSLMQGLCDAAKIDRIIKGTANGDVWNEFLQLGLCFINHKH